MNRRLIFILPVLGFLVLAFFLFRALWTAQPDRLPSALINKPAPRLTLAALDSATQGFGPAQLAAGHVSVVNVFGSWCIDCRLEAPAMMELAKQPGFELYGMVQRDTPQKARAFLEETGNPFSRIGNDVDGKAGIEWGVYGAPETFVVNGKGVIRYKIIGPLDQQIIAHELLPAIKAAQAS